MLTGKIKSLVFFSFGLGTSLIYFHSKEVPVFSHQIVSKTSNSVENITRTKLGDFPQFMKSYYKCVDMNKFKHLISPSLFEHIDYHEKSTFVVKIIKFNNSLELINSNTIFKNIFFAIVDSQLGYYSALLFGTKPCATAYLGYECFKEIQIGKEYVVFGYKDSLEGKNAFVNAVVFDENHDIVMRFNSRFVKIDWKNSFKLKN